MLKIQHTSRCPFPPLLVSGWHAWQKGADGLATAETCGGGGLGGALTVNVSNSWEAADIR